MTKTKNLKIIPIQVVEEVTRTTLSGIEKTYMVQFPDSKKTIVDISSLKGEFFQNIKTLKTEMIQNATNSINKMISVAVELFGNKCVRIEEPSAKEMSLMFCNRLTLKTWKTDTLSKWSSLLTPCSTSCFLLKKTMTAALMRSGRQKSNINIRVLIPGFSRFLPKQC